MQKRGIFLNKKGTHVEVFLSFVLFITFLIFLIVILAPVKTKENKQKELDELTDKLIEKFSSDVASIKIRNNSGYYECLQINKTALKIGNYSRMIVKDVDNFFVNSSEHRDVLRLEWKTPNKNFFRIYFSNESFRNSTMTKTNCSNASVEFVRTDKYLFDSKISSLASYYMNNYEILKTELKIPQNTEFSFNFRYENNSEIKTREKSLSGDVFVESINIQYLDNEANIQNGELRIEVW